jgi:hypothetical protein
MTGKVPEVMAVTSGTGRRQGHAVESPLMPTRSFALAAILLAGALPNDHLPAASEALPKVIVPAPREAEWFAYRHAYKAARFFAPFLKTRPLIQAHMQIRPVSPDEPMDGLQVQLTGESVNITIPVDALGRATLPMLKQAYDEDAVLRLNRQQGHYRFSGRFSIRERDDGIYRVEELRAACEQVLSAQRESGYSLHLIGKHCVGVKFVYLPGGEAQVAYRGASGTPTMLASAPAEPFEGPAMGKYQVVEFRFANWPAQGAVVAHSKPLAVSSLYD